MWISLTVFPKIPTNFHSAKLKKTKSSIHLNFKNALNVFSSDKITFSFYPPST